jgi:hypothetical protein
VWIGITKQINLEKISDRNRSCGIFKLKIQYLREVVSWDDEVKTVLLLPERCWHCSSLSVSSVLCDHSHVSFPELKLVAWRVSDHDLTSSRSNF